MVFTKSAQKSIEFRQLGNDQFSKHNLTDSLELYSLALQQAPHNSKEFALAFGNRSAVLMEMKHYEAAITDLKRAEDTEQYEELPTSLKSKLSKRRENAEKFHAQKLKDTPATPQTVEKEPLGPSNAAFSSFCNKVTIRHDETKGRKVIAKKDIQPGTLILREEAYAATLFDPVSKYLCQFCCETLPNNWLPCLACSDPRIRFCNADCREKSIEFHQYECRFEIFEPDLKHSTSWRAFLSKIRETIRVLVQSKPDDLIECHNRAQSNPEFVSKFGCGETEHFQRDLQSIMTFYGHQWEKQWDPIIPKIVEHFANLGYFARFWPKGLKLAKKQAIFSEVFKWLLSKLCCNSYSIDPFFANNGDNSEFIGTLLSEGFAGSAIYLNASLINHSCLPNIFQISEGRILELRATKIIKAGEEIVGNYGPKFGLHPKKTRRELLMLRFDFLCDCAACSLEHYSELEAEQQAVNCEKCTTPIKNQSSKCPKCDQKQKYTPKQITEQLQKFQSMARQPNLPLENRLKMLEILGEKSEQVFAPYNETLMHIRGDIANQLIDIDSQTEKSIELYWKIADYYEHYFGKQSFEYEQILSKIVVACFDKKLTKLEWFKGAHEELKLILGILCGTSAARNLIGMYHGRIGLFWWDMSEKMK